MDTYKRDYFVGMVLYHRVTGWDITVVEVLEHHCMIRLRNGNINKFQKEQLDKWLYKPESVTSKATTVESVTSKATTVESVTSKATTVESVTDPMPRCQACGKTCSPRAKTCSPACRKRLSRMK